MLNEPTVEKLKAMRLDALATAWIEQQSKPDLAGLSFDERFAMLVDAEWMYRENRRLRRALKEAKLRLGQACIEDVDYPAKRELDRAVIRQLSTCRWVEEHQNVVITGATGTGKTYVACALAHQACRKGHRAIYRRASRLTDELTLARADGTYARALARLARVDVLVIDDWGHAPIAAAREHEEATPRKEKPAPEQIAQKSLEKERAQPENEKPRDRPSPKVDANDARTDAEARPLAKVKEPPAREPAKESDRALITHLGALGATTLSSDDANEVLTSQIVPPTPHVASRVQNILLLRYVELRSQLYRLLSIVKRRGSAYDRAIREFSIGRDGISVADTFASAEAVLGGLAHALPATKPGGKSRRGRKP